ncbi:hypothetical protein V5O48_007672 [Marasmius crinis-equi]|uniref:GST N-terminal domain-containing protein n=1 Tax=Marasmius crinis-equi TaxID=585013 RepID=A0ABR3FG03_9AGAR
MDEGMGLSPFVRAIRFALNYKKIPYTVIDLGMQEVEQTAKSIGAPPTMGFSTGSPRYTVPMIHDSTTGKAISESFNIAEYLDEAYPDTPRIIPPGTRMLQSTFCMSVFTTFAPLLPVLRPVMAANFQSPEFSEGVRKRFGDGALQNMLTPEEEAEAWKKVVLGFKLIGQGYGAQGAEDSAFVMGGATPTFADLYFTSFLWWLKRLYGDTQEWKDIAAVADGKLGRLCEGTLAACKR